MAKSKDNTVDTTPVKTSKKKADSKRDTTKRVIIGIGELFAVMSIAYTTSLIVMGTEGIVPLVAVAPQVILATVIAVKRFIK